MKKIQLKSLFIFKSKFLKRLVAFILFLTFPLSFSSCWDYRSLDSVSIVAGIAVDVNLDNPEEYIVSYEIVVTPTGSDKGKQASILVEAKGKSINDTVKNVNKQLKLTLSFSHAEILIISESLAKDGEIKNIIDPFLRDNETRDNMMILVSCGETAKEILDIPEEEEIIAAFEIHKSLVNDNSDANLVKILELYQVYNILAEGVRPLTLPTIRFLSKEDYELTFDGMALFNGENLESFLNNEETTLFMVADGKVTNGNFNIPFASDDNTEKYMAISVRDSTAAKKYKYNGEQFELIIDIDMLVAAVEFSKGWNGMDFPLLLELEKQTAQLITRNITQFILDVRNEHESDVMGFGSVIYRHDPKLWNSIKDDWASWFKNAKITVNCNVKITNTGVNKDF